MKHKDYMRKVIFKGSGLGFLPVKCLRVAGWEPGVILL